MAEQLPIILGSSPSRDEERARMPNQTHTENLEGDKRAVESATDHATRATNGLQDVPAARSGECGIVAVGFDLVDKRAKSAAAPLASLPTLPADPSGLVPVTTAGPIPQVATEPIASRENVPACTTSTSPHKNVGLSSSDDRPGVVHEDRVKQGSATLANSGPSGGCTPEVEFTLTPDQVALLKLQRLALSYVTRGLPLPSLISQALESRTPLPRPPSRPSESNPPAISCTEQVRCTPRL